MMYATKQIPALFKKKADEKTTELSERQKKLFKDSPGRSLKGGRLLEAPRK
jgi:hypothetical protein